MPATTPDPGIRPRLRAQRPKPAASNGAARGVEYIAGIGLGPWQPTPEGTARVVAMQADAGRFAAYQLDELGRQRRIDEANAQRQQKTLALTFEMTPDELEAVLTDDVEVIRRVILRGFGGKLPLPEPSFAEPENRGLATMSEQGDTAYVEDLIRPGRIVVWAAEEGSGKSYTVNGELAIRLAVAGGDFAGSWPVLTTGSVLVLSEMHADDDYRYETDVLTSLDADRSALDGVYWRLPLMTAAGEEPVLMVPAWRSWITGWMRERSVILMNVDTATGAAQVDPWGKEIQGVFRSLRAMLDDYPALAIVLVVHLKKPSGRGGERRISDVLGEWGRWCDVLVLQENDGASLTRTKLTVRKRVRKERRIVATKSGGLLIDASDITEGGAPKVPQSDVVAIIEAHPAITAKELGVLLEVSKDTAARYARDAESAGLVRHDLDGPRGAHRYFAGPESAAELLSQVRQS